MNCGIRKYQSILEYSLLVVALVAALAVMQRYIKGAMSSKLNDVLTELNRLR
jgi:hypothetical protein